jgi:uncharacterized protein (TIGR02145 family)
MRISKLFAGIAVALLSVITCTKNPANTGTGADPVSVSDIDGNVYPVIRIGDQLWSAENLRTTKYNDGTPVAFDTSATWIETTGKYCYCNNTADADSIRKFGAIYNWYAVNTKKLAPAGWHVPTDAEWTKLEKYLVINGYNWDGTTDTSTSNKIAQAMAAKTDWFTSIHPGAVGYDLPANNRSGFSGLPGGDHNNVFGATNIGVVGDWWSATDSAATLAFHRYLSCGADNLYRFGYLKSNGLAVRVVRDY